MNFSSQTENRAQFCRYKCRNTGQISFQISHYMNILQQPVGYLYSPQSEYPGVTKGTCYANPNIPQICSQKPNL